MPTIAVHNRSGEDQPKAIEGLLQLVEARMKIGLTFDDQEIARTLVRASGGSIRDLLRLVEGARLNALVEDHTVIEASDAAAAIKDFSIGLQTPLIPTNIYFPILAEVALNKRCEADDPQHQTPEEIDRCCAFFHRLIVEGVVFEYNGDETWHDVHPTLHRVPLFREEYENLKAARKRSKKAPVKGVKSRGKASRKR